MNCGGHSFWGKIRAERCGDAPPRRASAPPPTPGWLKSPNRVRVVAYHLSTGGLSHAVSLQRLVERRIPETRHDAIMIKISTQLLPITHSAIPVRPSPTSIANLPVPPSLSLHHPALNRYPSKTPRHCNSSSSHHSAPGGIMPMSRISEPACSEATTSMVHGFVGTTLALRRRVFYCGKVSRQ